MGVVLKCPVILETISSTLAIAPIPERERGGREGERERQREKERESVGGEGGREGESN